MEVTHENLESLALTALDITTELAVDGEATPAELQLAFDIADFCRRRGAERRAAEKELAQAC
jgi:hypothetical protein